MYEVGGRVLNFVSISDNFADSKKEIDEFPKNFQLVDEKKYGISKIIFGSYS